MLFKIFNSIKKMFDNPPQSQIFSSKSNSNELLKEATKLKREKKYLEACEKLKEAYSADDAKTLMIEDYLRLPMYLQLAGKNDDGWRVLNELNTTHIDVYSQAVIANQIRIFLEKEKNFEQAILFSVWTICKEIERDNYNIQMTIQLEDDYAKRKEYSLIDRSNLKVVAFTPNNNPITDTSYVMFMERITNNQTSEHIASVIDKNMKKINLGDKIQLMSQMLSQYISKNDIYNLREIRDIIAIAKK